MQQTAQVNREVGAEVVEKTPAPARETADFGLIGQDPKATLETIKTINAFDHKAAIPAAFGDLSLLSPDATQQGEQRTRIRGTGARRDTEVSIRYDAEGRATELRDHLGEWTSTDGGKTWKTGEPNFRVRRGETSIDEKGNYIIKDTDYGVKSTFSPDGTSTRTIETASGERYSVQKNAQGVPLSFTDPKGIWTGDGTNWTNQETGETRKGRVSISEHGQFSFRSIERGGENTVRQTSQLDRIQTFKAELERDFNVKFAKPGEKVPDNEGRPAFNGMPTEGELQVLKDVLEKTKHENYAGTKLWFVRPHENGDEAYGHYSNDNDNGDGRHSCGGACKHGKGKIATAGGDMVILPRARQNLHGTEGLEGTLLHEFGHHEQGERFGHQTEWGGRRSTQQARQMAQELGWVYSPRLGENLLKDKNGGLWRYNEKKDDWRWAGGTRPADNQRRLESKEMRERALVRPSTNYFPYPYEHHAEALAMFRVAAPDEGGTTSGDRRTLAQDTPDLYKKIREFDQRSIDRSMGTNEQGESKYIRDLNGRLIENTAENRRRIHDAERSWGVR